MARLIGMFTPWYSEADAERREQCTEDLRQRSIRARINSEQLIASYKAADERLGRMSGR